MNLPFLSYYHNRQLQSLLCSIRNILTLYVVTECYVQYGKYGPYCTNRAHLKNSKSFHFNHDALHPLSSTTLFSITTIVDNKVLHTRHNYIVIYDIRRDLYYQLPQLLRYLRLHQPIKKERDDDALISLALFVKAMGHLIHT